MAGHSLLFSSLFCIMQLCPFLRPLLFHLPPSFIPVHPSRPWETAALQAICKEYHQRIAKLEDAKYDLEYSVRQKEFVISELNMQVNDMRGKFIKPPLKKVSRFEYGKFEKLMRAAKKADNDFRANLKSVGPSQKFKLEDDVKETKPDWALGAKKEQAEE